MQVSHWAGDRNFGGEFANFDECHPYWTPVPESAMNITDMVIAISEVDLSDPVIRTTRRSRLPTLARALHYSSAYFGRTSPCKRSMRTRPSSRCSELDAHAYYACHDQSSGCQGHCPYEHCYIDEHTRAPRSCVHRRRSRRRTIIDSSATPRSTSSCEVSTALGDLPILIPTYESLDRVTETPRKIQSWTCHQYGMQLFQEFVTSAIYIDSCG